MGVLQAVKNGFVSIVKNLKLWILVVVIGIVLMVISIPIALAVFGQVAFQPGATLTPEQMANINWPLFVMFIIAVMLVQTFINAGVVGSVKDIVKTGSANLGNFVGNAKKFFLRFILFTILMLLIGLGVLVVFLLLGALVGIIGNAVNVLGVLLGTVLVLLFLAVIILVGVYGSFGPTVIVAENKGLFESMGMTLRFIKERLWKALGLLAMLLLVFLVAFLVFIVIFFIIGAVIGITSGGVPTLSRGVQVGINISSRVIWNLIVTYLTLVFISSLMSYYLGNAEAKPSSSEP